MLHLEYDVNHADYNPSKQNIKEKRRKEKERRTERERRSTYAGESGAYG